MAKPMIQTLLCDAGAPAAPAPPPLIPLPAGARRVFRVDGAILVTMQADASLDWWADGRDDRRRTTREAARRPASPRLLAALERLISVELGAGTGGFCAETVAAGQPCV